ncbi:MAG: hypothetical protein HZB17_10470 [Chloroflexi bacterium]|nr:hypothetical protein [Chloroflexota bacterium]
MYLHFYKRALLVAGMILIAACSPRPLVIEVGVAATLTSLAPTPIVPLDRPTSTPVPVVMPASETPLTKPTTPPPTLAPTVPSAAPTQNISATTAAPTSTSAPTSTPAPTATATEAPTAIKVGAVIFEETFESQGLWAIGDAGDSSVNIAGGILTYTQKSSGSYSVRIIGRQGDDFYAEVGATPPGNCGTLDKYGLIFRAQDVANYYVFQLDCDGRYRLLRFGGSAANPLIDWTTSSTITRGSRAFNVLGVQAKGSTMTLFINQTKVDTATDSAYSSGRFGLWLGSNVTRDFTVKFNGMRAFKLP